MIEHASLHEPGGFHPAARAPLHIRQAINRNRRQMGLPPIRGLEERVAFADPLPAQSRGPVAWVDPAGRLGRLAGAPPRSGRRLEPAAPATVTRVLLVCDYGTAPPSATGRSAPEKLCRGAFGTAA